MSARDKIIPASALGRWRAKQRATGRTVVVTNGCFDLLHAGHVTYLEAAASHGDLLLVGVNDDPGVRELKGPTRPLNHEADRALVLAGLASVGAVSIFHGSTATEFLRVAQPDVYVKGGDYRIETLNQEERSVVESGGGKFVFIPFLEGRSTTELVRTIQSTVKLPGVGLNPQETVFSFNEGAKGVKKQTTTHRKVRKTQ